jgi:very long chain acyl-CoA dehydrogenase
MAGLMLRYSLNAVRPVAYQCLAGYSRSYSDGKSLDSDSFIMNTFLGRMNTKEVFPFPDPITKDQRENLAMFVDPVDNFFQVISRQMTH